MPGQSVKLAGVGVRHPSGFVALRPTDLEVPAGAFFCVLGPARSGKSMLLRVIAGFVEPTGGQVLIGGRDQTAVPAKERPVALVFRNLALFPLMTVRDNIASGLEARGLPLAVRRERAEAILDLVSLPGQGDKKPSQLSGGQRQCVALARALIGEPAVLLLDEPLLGLEGERRRQMRGTLRAIQQRVGATFLCITSDRDDALAMADRVAVINHGRIEQVDTTEAVYAQPRTAFAATFAGEMNVFSGVVVAVTEGYATIDGLYGRLTGRRLAPLSPGDEGMVFVRPERLRPGPVPEVGRNGLAEAAGRAPGGIAAAAVDAVAVNALNAILTGREPAEPPDQPEHLVFDVRGRLVSARPRDTAGLSPVIGSHYRLSFLAEDAIALPSGELAPLGEEDEAR